jgi:hypothetical protein
MLLQETGIPDNLAYLFLGLAVLFLILGGWIGSLFWRMRNLRRDMALLEDMLADEAEASEAPPAPLT